MIVDTHILLWWLFDDPRLSAKSREILRNTDNVIYVSAASVWEIATKFRLGKLNEAASVAKNVPMWIKRAGFQALPVTAEHAQLAGSWKMAHRDPFDRMLAAQAKLEKVPLISDDSQMSAFPIVIIT
ncbi:MAG: type II toxin-antitoxin system VapC family toxin [Desulfobacteraceae bacterium]|nr:type II toxin-antitoxin system VapC family toxin [Desulfobacteraceae bacterium]